jgi:hypothetical protein
MHNFRFLSGSLIIETDRLEETLDYVRKERIENLHISRFHGYKSDDIKPLLGLSGIKKITFQSGIYDSDRFYDQEIDLTGVEHFAELEYLRIDDKQPVDLAAFKKLKFLVIHWSNKIMNFDQCLALEQLNLWHFNTKTNSFKSFPYLQSLKELNLYWGNAATLEGLRLSDSIRKIEFHRYPKLTSISPLKHAISLESLSFEYCKRLQDHSSVGFLENLRCLVFDYCGEIADLQFIEKMAHLEDFNFRQTNIRDGNLYPLASRTFRFLLFDSRKHYTHTLDNQLNLIKQ